MATALKRSKRRTTMASPVKSVGSKGAIKKIVIDFPRSLYEETERATHELAINRSTFVRQAVAFYLEEMRSKKLEGELVQGYLANAESARRSAEELMSTESDLA